MGWGRSITIQDRSFQVTVRMETGWYKRKESEKKDLLNYPNWYREKNGGRF